MISRIPFLPGGLALIVTACAVSQPGTRRSSPIDHALLRGEQLHTERQILEGRDINLLSAFGNLVAPDSRNLSVHLAGALEAPEVEGSALKLVRLLPLNNALIAVYTSPEQRGALSLIDVSHPETPLLRAEVQFPTVGIETVAVEGRQIYFAGNSSDPGGPVVGRISFQDFEWLDDLQVQALPVKAVDAIALLDDKVLISDSAAGQVTILQKKDFVTAGQVAVPGVEALVQDKASVWALTKDSGAITQLDPGLRPLARIAAGGAMQGPLLIGQETVLAVMGENGVRSYCKADRQALFNIPTVTRAELSGKPQPIVGASLSQGLLMTANADAGVYVFQVSTNDKQGVCKGRSVQLHGYLDLGKSFRAESLSWNGGVLSVGDAEGRLNLISIESERLENDDVDFDG